MNDFLQEVELLLKSGGDRDALAQQILNATLLHFDSETGTIHWLDKEKQVLRLAAQTGLPEVVLDAIRTVPVGKGIAGQTVERNEPVSLCNLQTDTSGVARPGAKATGIGGMICVPVRFEGKTIGAFGIGTARPHQYSPTETHELEEIGRLIGERLNVKSLVRTGWRLTNRGFCSASAVTPGCAANSTTRNSILKRRFSPPVRRRTPW